MLVLNLILAWYYAIPPMPPTKLINSKFTNDNATVLLYRFKRSIQWRDQTALYKVITTDYTIHRCEGSIENRDNFWQLIEQMPKKLIHVYDLYDIINVDENSITTDIDGAKVVFGIRKSSNGKYQLWKETHYDCSRKGVLSSMIINYYLTAYEKARSLIYDYVKGFHWSVEKFSNAVNYPYRVFYCLKNGEAGLLTFENMYDIKFPSLHADPSRRKTLLEFRNVQLYSNGSIIFSVHNGGFNHYFEATRKDRDNYTLFLEKRLDCTDRAPTGFEITELQYATVYNWELD